MVSDIQIEKPLGDETAAILLEELRGKTLVTRRRDEEDVELESECGDEIFPAMAWI